MRFLRRRRRRRRSFVEEEAPLLSLSLSLSLFSLSLSLFSLSLSSSLTAFLFSLRYSLALMSAVIRTKFTELLSRMRNQNQNQNQNPLQQQQKQKQQKQQERMMMPVPVPVPVPVFGAPMAGASGGALAAAVARGGGLGSIAFPLKGEQKIPTSDDPCGSIRRFAEQLDLFESQAPKGERTSL